MLLSIIIVNYNARAFLEKCLRSVEAACKVIDAEVFVIDNASTDGSREFFAGRFPAVNFEWLDENLGFSKANNLALEKASGEFVLFLNPDTVIPEVAFARSVAVFREHADCGALGVRMINGNGVFLPESKRDSPTLKASFLKLFSKNGRSYYATQVGEYELKPVPVLSGAYLMMRTALAKQLGGFDEDFFMYGEDVDLSLRAAATGYKNYYAGNISITHFKGGSTDRADSAYAKHFYGAMRIFARKHYRNKPLKKLAALAGSRVAEMLFRLHKN